MNKEFEYRRYKFNINVELNTRVERGINGDKWHTIITNCMGFDNYYKKEEIKDEYLIVGVDDAERLAKKYVDKKIDGIASPDNRLSELGFK